MEDSSLLAYAGDFITILLYRNIITLIWIKLKEIFLNLLYLYVGRTEVTDPNRNQIKCLIF